MKRFPNGIDEQGVLPAEGAGQGPDRRARRGGGGRRGRAEPAGRRIAEDAALHDAARGHLAGPVVLARAVAGHRRPCAPSISTRCRMRRSRACSTSRAGCATSSPRWAPPAIPKTSGADGLHIFIPLPRGHTLRGGPHLLPDCRDDGRGEAPEGRHRGTRRPRTGDGHGLRGLPAEHRGQVAGVRLQCARERLRRRIDAADVGGDRQRRRSHATSRSARSPLGWRRSATCGRGCANRRASS